MPKPKAQILSKVCERCSAPFTVPDKVNYREKRYCTRACSNAATAEQRASTLRGKQGYQPPTCPCGKEVTATRKYVYVKDKKYCSDECRKKYGLKRQKNPENHATFNCQNCGVEVTRRKGLGHHKYCSNECAAKHTKVKKHYGVEGLEIVFDSSYEVLFWGLCTFLKVQVERFDRANAIPFGEKGFYAPDFTIVLRGQSYDVEVKGFEDDDDRARYAVWREQRGPLVVLDHRGLSRLRMAYVEEWPSVLTGDETL